MKPVSIYPAGDQAIVISFGNALSVEANAEVIKLFHRLATNKAKFWIDLIPAYSSLTILYHAAAIRQHQGSAFEWVRKQVMEVVGQDHPVIETSGRLMHVPVCYDFKYGFDLKSILTSRKLTHEQLITLHTSKTYRVFMIGFLPGFPYMGAVDGKIATPRLATPRPLVPAGSVGIAGNQTGIYPLDSPGGWNIIGRTPLQLFDANRAQPALVQPGDAVKFSAISSEEFDTFNFQTFNLYHEP